MSEEISEDITDDEFLPPCCDDMKIEVGFENGMMVHICSNCSTIRHELD